MKSIDTLVEDIYGVFDGDVEITQESINQFGKRVAEVLADRILEKRAHKPELRMSQIGQKDRRIYYDRQDTEATQYDGPTRIKFLYGDLVEELVFFLIKAAGHTVTDEQKEVMIDGVKGHMDGKVDGVTSDVKSASKYGFRKFVDGSITEGNDPFGYIPQLSGYTEAEGEDEGAFIVVNKESGEIAVIKIHQMEMINAHDRITQLKATLASDIVPDRCYSDVADGTSGNRTLDTNCGWCRHKFKCWSDSNNGQGLRGFKYSNGIRYLTNVAKTPKVEEVV